MGGSGGTGGKGGSGGKGGKGGKGGSNADRLKRQRNESLEETEARLLKASAAKRTSRASAPPRSAEEHEAFLLHRREKRGGALSAQRATHLLIAQLCPLDDAILGQHKVEIEKYLVHI